MAAESNSLNRGVGIGWRDQNEIRDNAQSDSKQMELSKKSDREQDLKNA
jgi:hypothetical protein